MSENNNHILYISYDGLTDPLGESQILPYLAGIKKEVGDIHILSTEKRDRFSINKDRIANFCHQHNLVWHHIPYSKNPPFFSTFFDILTLQRRASQLCKAHNIQLVHCRSYVACYIGFGIQKQLGIPYIFDMRGLWADERVDGGIWNLKNFFVNRIYRFVKSLESKMLTNAEHIVSLTAMGKKELLSWPISLQEKDITIIPCCVDEQLFAKDSIATQTRDDLRSEMQIDASSLVLGYSGSIGTWYLLDDMLKFYQFCSKKISNCRFLILTPDTPASILEKADELGISTENIIIKSCHRGEMPKHLSIMDVAVFFIKPKYSKLASSPTKFAEFMSMGIPVVCNDGIGDMKDYFSKYAPGLLLKELNDQSFEKAANEINVLKTLNKKDLCAIASHEFSLEKGIRNYVQIYTNIFNGDTSPL